MVLPCPGGVHARVKQSADTNGQYSPLHRTPLRVTALTAMTLYCHMGPRRQRGAQPAKSTEDSTVGNRLLVRKLEGEVMLSLPQLN